MQPEELIERSPMRAVAASIRGGLEPGQVGAVLAAAGVGKSAFMVQVALHSLLKGKPRSARIADGQSGQSPQFLRRNLGRGRPVRSG